MSFKKMLSLGLAVVMTMSVLAGCGKEGGKESSSASKSSQASSSAAASSSATPASSSAASSEVKSSEASSQEPVKEEITFPLAETMEFDIVGMQIQPTAPLTENISLLYLQEKANFKFNWTEIPGAEMAEKVNLMMAGGTYPEVLFKTNIDADQYGTQGLLLPLEDIIKEHMPNLTALLDELNLWKDAAASDGHIYSLPYISSLALHAGGQQNYNLWINARWLENVGMENPTSMEELYEVLKAFKEQDANGNGDATDEIPVLFSGVGACAGIRVFYQHMGDGQFYVGENVAIMKEDAENGVDKLTYYPTTDAYYEFLEWMAKFYAEGLIHKDVFTITGEQLKAITMGGDVTGMIARNNPNNIFAEPYKYDYDRLTFFDEDMVSHAVTITKGGLALTDKMDVEKAEIFCAFYDYLYTEEGGLINLQGVPGETWEWVDDAHTQWKPINRDKYASSYQYALSGSATVAHYQTPSNYLKQIYENKITEEVQVPFAIGGEIAEMGVYLPNLSYTEDESERLSVLYADINGAVNNYVAEVVTGIQNLESSWEEFQNTLKKMGVEEMLSIYQAAYDRAK